jgi:hypothetical protein
MGEGLLVELLGQWLEALGESQIGRGIRMLDLLGLTPRSGVMGTGGGAFFF